MRVFPHPTVTLANFQLAEVRFLRRAMIGTGLLSLKYLSALFFYFVCPSMCLPPFVFLCSFQTNIIRVYRIIFIFFKYHIKCFELLTRSTQPEGCDHTGRRLTVYKRISIHAAHAGCDFRGPGSSLNICFILVRRQNLLENCTQLNLA